MKTFGFSTLSLGALCVFALLGSTGCAAIPLATAGSVLGFAGTAASAGSEVYSLGKLDFSVMASYDQARRAAVGAAGDLQLHVIRCSLVGKRTDELLIELEDDLNRKVDVRIDRRAEKLCECRVDVGLFGSEPTAKLIMDRIRAHLPKAAGKGAGCEPVQSGNHDVSAQQSR